jgi:2,4-dienoyl-CoA reductase-like NADH-dependent reductase (Old Yellow Enzyme family)
MSIKPEEVKQTFKSLQKPLKLNDDLTLRNRLIMASLTRSRGVPEDYVNKWAVEYYRQRSGAGLILSEGTLISPQGSVVRQGYE